MNTFYNSRKYEFVFKLIIGILPGYLSNKRNKLRIWRWNWQSKTGSTAWFIAWI